jgi:hypothetical protein
MGTGSLQLCDSQFFLASDGKKKERKKFKRSLEDGSVEEDDGDGCGSLAHVLDSCNVSPLPYNTTQLFLAC